jgi:hypothetical protein
MDLFFWKKRSFWNDVEQETKLFKPERITISSAYLSLSGVNYLKKLQELTCLKKKDIFVYCSFNFHDKNPAEVLRELNSFANVYIVIEPFLHSKIYEINFTDKVIFYHGSANLTEGGVSINLECMSKITLTKSPVSDLWDYLSKNCIVVNKAVIELYQSYQESYTPITQSEDRIKEDLEKYKYENKNIEETSKIDIKDKFYSRDIERFLFYFYGKIPKSNEALSFLKEIDGCLLELVNSISSKPVYTVPKENFWKHLLSVQKFKKILEKREIKNLQELSVAVDDYYVKYFYK